MITVVLTTMIAISTIKFLSILDINVYCCLSATVIVHYEIKLENDRAIYSFIFKPKLRTKQKLSAFRKILNCQDYNTKAMRRETYKGCHMAQRQMYEV